MAQLAARLLAAALAQALGLAPQAVAGGWLPTIVAVLGQLRLQLLHAREQQGDLLALLGILGFQFSDPGFGGHAPILLCSASLPDLLQIAVNIGRVDLSAELLGEVEREQFGAADVKN